MAIALRKIMISLYNISSIFEKKITENTRVLQNIVWARLIYSITYRCLAIKSGWSPYYQDTKYILGANKLCFFENG